MDERRKYHRPGYVSPGEKHDGVSLAATLNDMIDEMSDVYGAPPHMAAALRLNHVRLFTTGIDGLDAEIRSTAKERLQQFLIGFKEQCLVLNNPVITPRDPAEWRRNLEQRSENEANLLDGWAYDERMGLSLQPIFAIAEGSIELCYLPERFKSKPFNMVTVEFEKLLGPEFEGAGGYEVVKALHQGRITGLPLPHETHTIPDEEFEKARLEFTQRSEQGYYLAQLASSDLLVEHLYAFYMSGEPASSTAALLFQDFKDKLFDDDVPSKVAMLERFSFALLSQAAQENNDIAKAYFEHLSRTISTIGNDLVTFVDTLMTIHARHEIELPEYLLAYETKIAQRESLEVIAETPETEVPAVSNDQEKLGALEERIKSLRSKIDQAFEEIILSKSARSNAGFAPFKEAFGRGLDVDGISGRFERIGPDQAKQMFDTLVYLYNLSGQYPDLKERQQVLQNFNTIYKQLEDELHGLKAFAAKQNLTRLKQIDWPMLFPFVERTEEIRQDWSHIEWLILNKWRSDDEAANELKELLFAAPVQEAQQPRRLTEEEAQAYKDGHLNEVLFPRGREVTEKEVREAARKAGFTPRQMEDLVWERVRDLATVRDLVGGKLYDTKANEKFLGREAPYFIVLFEIDGHQYAIAESPIKSSATYIVAEQHATGSWSEILKVTRRSDARQFGAEYIIHSTKSPHGEAHVLKIMEKILELQSRPITPLAKP